MSLATSLVRRASAPVSASFRRSASSAAGDFQAPVIKTVGVLGLGLMGSGIAQVSASHAKLNVIAVDVPDALKRGGDMIQKSLATFSSKAVAKGMLSREAAEQELEETRNRIRCISDRGALSLCDIIIEAVPETMEVKTPIYSDLGRIARGDAILASNTSGLSIADLARIAGRPQSTIGLHYFNPVPLMQLVEVVKLDSTSPSVLAAAAAFATAQGKKSILCTDTPGFVVNRLLVPYLAQAMQLVEKGVASYRDVDVAMKLGAGYPMGPFQLSDYVGLDTTLSILRNWSGSYPGEAAFFVPKLLEQKVAEGKLGRKTGQGFYTWKGNQVVDGDK